jgi:hypothetical protein
MSFILLGILNAQAAGGVGITSWITTLGDLNNNRDIATSGIAFRQNGNLLIAPGYAPEFAPALIELDPLGLLVSKGGKKSYVLVSIGLTVAPISGDVYLFGREKGQDFPGITKYNAAGVYQWSQTFFRAGSNYSSGPTRSVAVKPDESSVIVTASSRNASNQWGMAIGEMSASNGSLLQQRIWEDQSSTQNQVRVSGVSGNADYAFFSGSGQRNGGGQTTGLTHAGQWSNLDWFFPPYMVRSTANTSDSMNFYAVGEMPTGAEPAYAGAARFAALSNNDVAMIGKGTGGFDWHGILYSTSGHSAVFYDVAYSSFDSCFYAVGQTTVGVDSMALITKWSELGVLQWQRRLSVSSTFSTSAANVQISPVTGAVLVSGKFEDQGNRVKQQFFAHLNPDGSDTGSVVINGKTFTYQEHNLTQAASQSIAYSTEYDDEVTSGWNVGSNGNSLNENYNSVNNYNGELA